MTATISTTAAARQREISRLRNASRKYYADRENSRGYWARQRALLLAGNPGYHTAIIHELRGTPPVGTIWIRPSSGGKWSVSRREKFGAADLSAAEIAEFGRRKSLRDAASREKQANENAASELQRIGFTPPAIPALAAVVVAAYRRAMQGGAPFRLGQWSMARGQFGGLDLTYTPFGDERDIAAFAAEKNQQRRRLIHATCGERVLAVEAMTLIQQDDFGTLYDTGMGARIVRVVCPSTGATYMLPVSGWCLTAHEAVAQTFGLNAAEYQPAAQA